MSRRCYPSFVGVLLLLVAQAAPADDVDAFVRAEMERQRIPGVSVAVLKEGKVVKAVGYGVANVELGVEATPESVYKIGSISKPLIATGIMLLVREGKLSLDDTVGKYLEGTPEAWKGTTLRHLLTHTSGIQREAPGFDPFKIQADGDVIRTAYPLPLRFQPGEKWEYCNVGYFSLAEIIRLVSGKPWGEFLQERVFGPLEMTATCPTNAARIIPNRANGYEREDDELQNADEWPALRPSGAFMSTVLDLARWETALQTDRLIDDDIKRQMWTPVTLNSGKKYPYGLGWNLEDFRGVSAVQHGGSLAGFRAQYLRWPEHGLAVIVLTNLGSANPETLAHGIAVQYVPELNLSSLTASASPDPKTDKLCAELLTGFAKGGDELPHATSELGTALGSAPQAMRETIANRLKGDSSLEFLTRRDLSGRGIERRGEAVSSVWSYRLGGGERANYCSFYLTADGRVADVDFSRF